MLQQIKVMAATGWRHVNTGSRDLAPGIGLCVLIAATSAGLQAIETHGLRHAYIDAVVIAILLGMTIRAFWQPAERWQGGVAVCAKQVLEIAVMLLGASLNLAAVAASGPLLLAVIVAIVLLSLAFSYGVSRMLGLSNKMSVLIACGNSICGNSAIAAVAPVIRASSDDVGAAISFTAILGVLTVLGLPLLISVCDLSSTQYGIVAGLTVYAVPQVLAATVPVGVVSTQMGTFVKLLRVLMLGPVVMMLSIVSRRVACDGSRAMKAQLDRSSWVPWFIPGFLLLALLRTFDLIPDAAVLTLAKLAGFLTVVSMAALGLGVDLALIGRVGVRVTSAVTLSLAALILVSLAAARLFD